MSDDDAYSEHITNKYVINIQVEPGAHLVMRIDPAGVTIDTGDDNDGGQSDEETRTS